MSVTHLSRDWRIDARRSGWTVTRLVDDASATLNGATGLPLWHAMRAIDYGPGGSTDGAYDALCARLFAAINTIEEVQP